MTDITGSGVYRTTSLIAISYGLDSLQTLPSLLSLLPSPASTAVLVLTSKSLANSPYLKDIISLLGAQYVGTFSEIAQHSPIASIERALDAVDNAGATALLGFGGGSVIDAGKAMSYFSNQRNGRYLPQIALPTTLSAAEFSIIAGYSNEEGTKVGVIDREISPKLVVLDPRLSLDTPERLWTSAGLRAVDHSVENMIRPTATPINRANALAAIRALFTYLLPSRERPDDLEVRAALQIAAWESLGTAQFSMGMGLSHAIGHRIGASFSIPHGICSCITLSPVLALLASSPGVLSSADLQHLDQAVSALPPRFLPADYSPSATPAREGELHPARILSRAVAQLVEELGLTSKLSEYGVKKGDTRGFAKKALEELEDWGGRTVSEEAIEELLERL